MTIKKIRHFPIQNKANAFICSTPTSCINGMCPACDPGRCNSRVDVLRVDLKIVYSK